MQRPHMGDRVREIVSGNEGIVAGEATYLWGCDQLLVHYTENDKRESTWWDVARLEVLERDALRPIAYQGLSEVQGGYRGADVAPDKT